MKLAVVQFDPQFGEPDRNLDRIEDLVRGVRADLIVLPELCSSGYLFVEESELIRLAEPMHEGRTISRLSALARSKNCAIAAGWAEATPEGAYNSASLLGPDGILAHYRKIHLFDREKLWFRPGDLPFSVVEWRGVRMGLMICFDWRFPEAARTLALRGADLLVHPSNLVLPWCPDAMLTRSLENNVFSVTANRCGVEERGGIRLRFIGKSQVVDPRGSRLGQLSEEESGVLQVEFDPERARNKQVTEHNHLWDDLRPQLYEHQPRG
jgi:predicted amidohydrolase